MSRPCASRSVAESPAGSGGGGAGGVAGFADAVGAVLAGADLGGEDAAVAGGLGFAAGGAGLAAAAAGVPVGFEVAGGDAPVGAVSAAGFGMGLPTLAGSMGAGERWALVAVARGPVGSAVAWSGAGLTCEGPSGPDIGDGFGSDVGEDAEDLGEGFGAGEAPAGADGVG